MERDEAEPFGQLLCRPLDGLSDLIDPVVGQACQGCREHHRPLTLAAMVVEGCRDGGTPLDPFLSAQRVSAVCICGGQPDQSVEVCDGVRHILL